MPSVTTNEALLELIRKSSIVDTEILARYANGAVSGQEGNPLKLARKMVADGVLTEWQAKFFASGRHRIKVGQYILLDRLDINEFGDRFLGIHRQLDRKVDICIFPEHLDQNAALFQAFLDRASRVAELDHPNLLHLYDIDKEHNRFFFVSEHEDGETLERIPIGTLTNRDIASIVSQCLEGLAYAHQRGIIHGRLNESQIRRSTNGIVRIRNIGLAELLRRLEEAGDAVDEYAIEHQPIDDMITIGVIGRKLVHQHQGHPKTEADRRLVMLLTDLSKFVPGQDQSIESIRQGITEWHGQPAHSPKQSVPEKQAAAVEPNSTGFSARTGLIIGGVVTLLVLLGVGGWFLFGGPASTSETASTGQNSDDNDQSDKDNDSTADDDGAEEHSQPDENSGVSALSDAVNNLNERTDPDDAATDDAASDDATTDDAESQADQTPPPANAANDEPEQGNQETSTQDNAEMVAANEGTESSGDADNEQTQGDVPNEVDTPAANEDSAVADSGNTTTELGPPFAALPTSVDIPVVLRNEAIPDKVKLGDVFTGNNFLLGMELISGDAISKQKLRFELERDDKEDGQGWKVKLSPRNNDELTVVGRFFRQGDELWFTWLDGAKDNEAVNFFRNCVLKLNTRNETRNLVLRKAIPNDPFLLTMKKPSVKSTLNLDWLPNEDAIVIQLLEMPAEEVPNQVYEPNGRILSKNVSEGVLCFNFDPEHRFAWIKFDSSVGAKIRLEATMQMFYENRVISFKEYTFKKFGEALSNRQSFMRVEFEQLNAYKPVDGEKEKHRDAVKQYSAELDRMNKKVNEYMAFAEVVPKLFDRQLVYRVYFNLEGTEVELVAPEPPAVETPDN